MFYVANVYFPLPSSTTVQTLLDGKLGKVVVL